MARCDERLIGFGPMDTREQMMEAVPFKSPETRCKTAIVAALEREVKPAVEAWRVTGRDYDGRTWRIYENQGISLVCGGIGPEAARRAAQAMVILCKPDVLVSLGFAGALDHGLKAGDSFIPRYVRNAGDNSIADTQTGTGTLLTLGFIATTQQKDKLAEAYDAQAVDMESAAVACVAQAHGLRFMAVKAISDDRKFDTSGLGRFVRDGRFSTTRYLVQCMLRPWLWPQVIRLAKNSARAAKTLSAWLNQYNQASEFQAYVSPEAHLISRPKN